MAESVLFSVQLMVLAGVRDGLDAVSHEAAPIPAAAIHPPIRAAVPYRIELLDRHTLPPCLQTLRDEEKLRASHRATRGFGDPPEGNPAPSADGAR